jgi:hypothetical protein
MSWIQVDDVSEALKRLKVDLKPCNCGDCAVKPGEPHTPGCDVERCSACGGQRISCGCGGEHDPLFARWTGFWPGMLEAAALGYLVRWDGDGEIMPDLNRLYSERALMHALFVKPKKRAKKAK